MPTGKHFNADAIGAAVDAKNVTVDALRGSCERILRGWYALPAEKRYPCGGGVCIAKNVSTPEHKALAKKVSALGMVLLKNDAGLLPLRKSPNLKVALIGKDAETPYVSGGGSGGVPTSNVLVSPLAAFTSAGVHVTYDDGSDKHSAAAAAAAADVAIVVAAAESHEGSDRKDLLLRPFGEHGDAVEDVIAAVAKANKKTVVSMAVPGQVLTDWRDDVGAIIVSFLPGEQYGNALASLVFGSTTPQGKLPRWQACAHA